MTSVRKPLLGGNWKMHKVRAEAEEFCKALAAGISSAGGADVDVVLFPSSPLLHGVARSLEETAVEVGGQDVHPAAQGAHTGDTSVAQLVDAGCTWTLCGHSERRADHGETDEQVGAKAKAAVEGGLVPLICIGESQEERESGRTFEVLERQLNAALAPRPERFALAYEPVWAIGTGLTATPEMAQEAHAFLRELLADLLGPEVAAVKRILYGGSAKPENVGALSAQPDIDGFLVGGASLDPEKFLAMIEGCSSRA